MSTCERYVGDVVVMDLHGALARQTVDTTLWDAVRELARRGHHKIVLNLEDARHTGPFGLSTLLGAMLAARQDGSDIKLLHVASRIDDLQFLVALYDYFDVFESEPDVLASFNGTRIGTSWQRSVPPAGMTHAAA